MPEAAASAWRQAVLCHRQGRLPEAERLYRRTLRLDRDHFEALHGLGIVRLQQNMPEEAARLIRKALYRRPLAAEAHNTLGLALAALGAQDAAIQSFGKALALDPGLAGAHDNLGLALMELRRPEEAAAHYEKALALRPDHAAAHNHLGGALAALKRHRQALAHFERAVAIDPELARAHVNRGDSLHALDRRDEAIAAYDAALAIAPGLADAHANRGAILEELGRLDEARQAFEKAVEHAPRRARFYHYLADHRRFAGDDPYFLALEGLAQDIASLPPEEWPHLHFALAKAHADGNRYERSFHHLVAGNAAQRHRLVYDESAALGLFDRIRSVFTAALLREKGGLGDPSPAPVFIVGMPRSGTTLVEQILASHNEVFGAGERDALNRAAAAPGIGFPEAIAAIPGDALRRFGADYVRDLVAAAPASARITDKMPGNFRFAGLIHLALPNARIIHVRRDPLDTCLSCFSKLFTGAHPYAYEQGELGRYYRGYERLMAHWRLVLPAGAMLELRYEELVADFEPQARRIVAYCGLDWDDSCLAFHRTRRAVRTASATQVRRPIYQGAVGSAQRYRQWLGPLIDALGESAAGNRG